MKKLKKLSVVFMITTLLSVSFTSCIDNEVSPLVEAIYQNQAALLAGQAAVQNAEANLLAAQAAAEQAQADLLAAQASSLADLTAAQVAQILANAGLTDAEAQALADLTAAEVAQMVANANYTDQQAAYIMAQSQALADMTAAQVAQILANAGYTDAQSAILAQQVLVSIANADYLAAQRIQYLQSLTATTALAVAQAQNDLALENQQFIIDMDALLAELDAAGMDLAIDYALSYRFTMSAANSILSQQLAAEATLANAQLFQTTLGMDTVSWAYAISQLQGAVTAKQANIDALTASIASMGADIAALEADIANNSPIADALAALEAIGAGFDDDSAANDIAQAEQQIVIDGIYDEYATRNELLDRYDDTLSELASAQADKDGHLANIVALEASITAWNTAIADYPTALAALQAAVTAAEGVETAAITAQGAAATAEATAAGVKSAANGAWATAIADLATLQAVIDSLEASLNAAAATLATEQGLYDAGIGAATSDVANTATAVTNAQNAITAAIATYEFWRDQFEGGPTTNGGYYWEDTTPAGVLGADVFGDFQSDATNVQAAAYARVATWTWNDLTLDGPTVDDTYTPATIDAAQQASLGAGENVIAPAGTISALDMLITYPTVAATEEYFIEVGLDDEWSDNLAEFQAATTALGNEDIFDVAPMAGDAYLAGADAYTVKWNAMVDNLDAIEFLANFGDDLDAAQEAYDDLRDVYEDELNLLNTAQALEVSTGSASASADSAWTTANNALTAANTAVTNAGNAVTAAEGAVTTFLATTIVDMQGWIATAEADILDEEADIALIDPIIDAKQAVLDAMQAEYDEFFGLTGHVSGLYADLHAELIAAYQALWLLEQAADVISDLDGLNDDLITAYGTAEDHSGTEAAITVLETAMGLAQDELDACIAGLALAIEVAEQALATAEGTLAAKEAYISYLEANVATLEQRYDNVLAIAANYLALMNEALGN